jgi:hypothetical protein
MCNMHDCSTIPGYITIKEAAKLLDISANRACTNSSGLKL